MYIVLKYALTIVLELVCFKLRGSHGLVFHNTVFRDTLSFDRKEPKFRWNLQTCSILPCRRINKLEASEVRNICSVFIFIFCRSLCTSVT